MRENDSDANHKVCDFLPKWLRTKWVSLITQIITQPIFVKKQNIIFTKENAAQKFWLLLLFS
jgi:hypothetical protein